MAKCPGEGISMTIIIVICATALNIRFSVAACARHGKPAIKAKRKVDAGCKITPGVFNMAPGVVT